MTPRADRSALSALPVGYANLLRDLKSRIRWAQAKAARVTVRSHAPRAVQHLVGLVPGCRVLVLVTSVHEPRRCSREGLSS